MYSSLDHLVLWIMLIQIDYAEIKCRGMMEYWNGGTLGLMEWDLNLYAWEYPENKIKPTSAFHPQHSIWPLDIWQKSSPGCGGANVRPFDEDSLFPLSGINKKAV